MDIFQPIPIMKGEISELKLSCDFYSVMYKAANFTIEAPSGRRDAFHQDTAAGSDISSLTTVA